MAIYYRFYEGEEDLDLQYSFWEKTTSKLPYAWKMTKSPTIFKEQANFHPHSRCFAFDEEELIGYMSFTGSGDFVSLGYPWVKDGYQEIQDVLFEKVYGFASSDKYGGRVFAQRFREQWEDQIHFLQLKGFKITNKSPIIGRNLTDEQAAHNSTLRGTWRLEEGFTFEKWKSVMEKNGEITPQELSMMEEYYGSVDFDFSLIGEEAGELVTVIGVTIRKDTSFAEALAISIHNEYKILFEEIFRLVMKEVYKRNGRMISVYERDVPSKCKSMLGLKEISKDVMMVK
jgi:hypothetical protein